MKSVVGNLKSYKYDVNYICISCISKHINSRCILYKYLIVFLIENENTTNFREKIISETSENIIQKYGLERII